jgi:hypothetical protein
MQRRFRLILFSSHKHRSRVVSAILWFLRQILDIEKDETRRNSDMLDRFDSDSKGVSRREYNAIEEAYSSCECAVESLESAIENLECAY